MDIGQSLTDIQTDDPLGLIRSDRAGWPNLGVGMKEGCRACEWNAWCGGGCPLATYRAFKRYDVPSPNCAIYRALYPRVVRLEALRVLKYARN